MRYDLPARSAPSELPCTRPISILLDYVLISAFSRHAIAVFRQVGRRFDHSKTRSWCSSVQWCVLVCWGRVVEGPQVYRRSEVLRSYGRVQCVLLVWVPTASTLQGAKVSYSVQTKSLSIEYTYSFQHMKR